MRCRAFICPNLTSYHGVHSYRSKRSKYPIGRDWLTSIRSSRCLVILKNRLKNLSPRPARSSKTRPVIFVCAAIGALIPRQATIGHVVPNVEARSCRKKEPLKRHGSGRSKTNQWSIFSSILRLRYPQNDMSTAYNAVDNCSCGLIRQVVLI